MASRYKLKKFEGDLPICSTAEKLLFNYSFAATDTVLQQNQMYSRWGIPVLEKRFQLKINKLIIKLVTTVFVITIFIPQWLCILRQIDIGM